MSRYMMALAFMLAPAWGMAENVPDCGYFLSKIGFKEHVLKKDDEDKAADAYVQRAEACLDGNEDNQLALDSLAVGVLFAVEDMYPDARHDDEKVFQEAMSRFAYKAFRLGALAGFPSSQHNYAMLHNADPRSVLATLYRQDYPTFMYWTRMAASQQEPRAMFNLAMRLAPEQPVDGVEPDYVTAFYILHHLKTRRDEIDILAHVKPYIDQAFTRTLERLGSDVGVDDLIAEAERYDWLRLAPQHKPREPGLM